MKSKNNKTKIAVTILFVIVAILTLFILSVNVNALSKGEVMTFSEVKNLGNFARYIAYKPNDYINLEVNDIFGLNGYFNGEGSGYSYAKEPLNNSKIGAIPKGHMMITYYSSGMCLFHFQGNKTDSKGWGNIVNVVEIDSIGKIRVYGNGSTTKTTATKDSGWITLTEEDEKQCMTALAYTLYQSSLYERVYNNDSWPNDGTLTKDLTDDANISGWNKMYSTSSKGTLMNIKQTISYLMTRNGVNGSNATKIFGKYASGNIDYIYSGLLSGSGYSLTPTYGGQRENTGDILDNALAEAQKQASEPAYEKKDTEATVYYDESKGLAYIGPFILNYTGGTPSISALGVSSDKIKGWTRRDANGFKEIKNAEELPPNSDYEFYIVADSEAVNEISSIKVKIDLVYNKYRARMAFTTYPYQDQQNLMFFAAVKDDDTVPVEWDVPNGKEVSIQKVDASGNKLKVAGIKFFVYNSSNTYIGCLETDENGKTNTIKLGVGQEYTIKEMQNHLYGYKGCIISDAKIVSGKGTISVNNGEVKVTISENTVISIENKPELGKLTLHKTGEEGKSLEGVQFVLWKGNAYLKLDEESVTNPIVTSDEGLDITKYNVTIVKTPEEATKFATNVSGKIVISNLEIYSGKDTKYNYWLQEVKNDNYGYKGMSITEADVTVTGGNKLEVREASREIKFDITNNTTVEIGNKPELGNLKLEKHDNSNSNIKLENVGFAIEIIPAPENAHAYIALYDKDGNLVSSVKGIATINSKNEATAEGKEYKLTYYCTEKAISEMSEEEKANLMTKITSFVTESDGTLTVNNLEVYYSGNKDKYKYKLIEISNSNYGYVADSVELGDIILEVGTTVNKDLGNQQKYTKLSGYVWIENTSGKSNNYDGVYTDGDLSNDIKLTDLYINKIDKYGTELIKNPEAVTPVEIKLCDKATGDFIKTQPDEFDKNGKYTFIDIEVEKLGDYEVVFVYNGFYYTTVVEQLDKDNGSKVKEVASEREALNNKFATVKNNSEVLATDGTTNTVEYYKDGHTSTVSKLNFDATLSANTTVAEYNLSEAFNAIKSSATTLTQELENVNMGIVLREQPKISINDDIYSVLVEFEGYKYNYKYNGRQNYYENKNGDDIGVKFEQENTEKRYTRTVYASDIQAAKDQSKEIKVSVTYKMQVANESRTLSVMTRQLINYFDARYEIKAVGLGLDEATHTLTDTLRFSEAQLVEGHPEYKSAVIDFNQTIEAGNSNVKSLYITFDIQRDAILDLLYQKSTYHNAVEILSYTSYYGAGTSMVDGVQFTTDQTKAGKLYAGIDKVSQPGNMEIVLIDHPSGDGTKILDTTNFEDDTSSAPSLLLEAGEAREISGTIWEDIATNTTYKQKLGDGIYDVEKEKPIQNVTVELHKINEDGSIGEIAKYSNETLASTKTDEKGNYTFGYYDENTREYVGVLPGKYVIEYNYNGESYIVGGKNINPNEYKSTIIASGVIENAFEAQDQNQNQNQRWYVVKEDYRYSDARDNIYLRPEYNSDIDANITVTNSTYNSLLSINNMEAHTPIMDIGIEFTETDEADALVLKFINELQNVDFGIIERPDIDIKIEKEITGLEVTSQTGSKIIPKGDPSDQNASMQYVKTGLSGLVSAEIESKLLQGATLNLEYTITIVNESDKDYLETDYYYYGRNGITETTSKVKLVVDYLDSTMALDETQNNEIWEVKGLDNLYNTETKPGLVHEEVYNELKSGNYHILTTRAFEEVGTGNEKSVKLYASKALAVSNSITEENHVEIIELTGKRTIKESIPGNYNPANDETHESDDDKVELVVTPPTGKTVNYIVYIIAGMATFAILVVGIVTIKKKIIL